MNQLQVFTNPKNIEDSSYLFTEIFGGDKDLVYKELEEKIKSGGEILTVESDEFNFPLAIAVISFQDENLIVEYAGVKEGFKNEGIWEELKSFIEFQAESKNLNNILFKELKIR